MKNLGRFKTKDSALAYFVNQLTNLDKKLYQPLVSVSWGRDIDLRSGITISNETTSFIKASYSGVGTLGNPSAANAGGNMPWISDEATALPGVSVNGALITTPLRPLARELSYTSIELSRSQATGQSIDTKKMNALNNLYQMNTDQMVYIGSADVGALGMLNNASVTASNVAAGAGGTTWALKTPAEILKDINTLLTATWSAGALAVCPSELRLPPVQFGLIATQVVSTAGNESILSYVARNCIANQINGKPLNIQPVKWLTGRGASGTDRMVAFTKNEEYIRFPMVPIFRETAYYQGLRFAAPYVWAFGEVEIPYTETIQYADGI